jgi:hypothetical protein
MSLTVTPAARQAAIAASAFATTCFARPSNAPGSSEMFMISRCRPAAVSMIWPSDAS